LFEICKVISGTDTICQ